MERLSFGPAAGRSIARFGSVEFTIAPLARLAGEGQVVCARLGPGGRIGRHPTVGAQLLAVVEGSGWVAGGDGRREPIEAGEAVLWQPGEEHETGTDEGLVAVIVEIEAATLVRDAPRPVPG